MLDNCLTKSVRYEVDKQIIIYLPMKEENVSVRDFLRNFKELAHKKVALIVQKNGKPEGVFVPYNEWEKAKKCEKNKGLSLKEAVEKYSFNGPKDLSQNIDEVCYGYPNPYRSDNN